MLCHFATELPSICAVNDAFWQQPFDFRRTESCPVPPSSLSHTVALETAAAALGFASGTKARVKGQGSGIAVVDFAALYIRMRPLFVLSGDCNALGR